MNVRRGAVAAAERETSAPLTDGEAVWFWRPEAGVKCAGTPTRRADDGVNKAVVPGESAEETVKPLRGECRMFSGASAVNTRVHTHYPQRTRGCGCIGHPAFPAPLFQRAKVSGRISGAP